MILIFILAGAFAGVARDIKAVDSTVNLGLFYFLAVYNTWSIYYRCFISLSIGTSMGTIVALVPIAVGIADKTGISTALAVVAVAVGLCFVIIFQ